MFVSFVNFLFFFFPSKESKSRIQFRTTDKNEKYLKSTASHRVKFYVYAHVYVSNSTNQHASGVNAPLSPAAAGSTQQCFTTPGSEICRPRATL